MATWELAFTANNKSCTSTSRIFISRICDKRQMTSIQPINAKRVRTLAYKTYPCFIGFLFRKSSVEWPDLLSRFLWSQFARQTTLQSVIGEESRQLPSFTAFLLSPFLYLLSRSEEAGVIPWRNCIWIIIFTLNRITCGFVPFAFPRNSSFNPREIFFSCENFVTLSIFLFCDTNEPLFLAIFQFPLHGETILFDFIFHPRLSSSVTRWENNFVIQGAVFASELE